MSGDVRSPDDAGALRVAGALGDGRAPDGPESPTEAVPSSVTRESNPREPIRRFSIPPIMSIPAITKSGKPSTISRTGGVRLTERPPGWLTDLIGTMDAVP